eukprot:168139-Pyramimonas_sp.AAC.1
MGEQPRKDHKGRGTTSGPDLVRNPASSLRDSSLPSTLTPQHLPPPALPSCSLLLSRPVLRLLDPLLLPRAFWGSKTMPIPLLPEHLPECALIKTSKRIQ